MFIDEIKITKISDTGFHQLILFAGALYLWTSSFMRSYTVGKPVLTRFLSIGIQRVMDWYIGTENYIPIHHSTVQITIALRSHHMHTLQTMLLWRFPKMNPSLFSMFYISPTNNLNLMILLFFTLWLSWQLRPFQKTVTLFGHMTC